MLKATKSYIRKATFFAISKSEKSGGLWITDGKMAVRAHPDVIKLPPEWQVRVDAGITGKSGGWIDHDFAEGTAPDIDTILRDCPGDDDAGSVLLEDTGIVYQTGDYPESRVYVGQDGKATVLARFYADAFSDFHLRQKTGSPLAPVWLIDERPGSRTRGELFGVVMPIENRKPSGFWLHAVDAMVDHAMGVRKGLA